MKKNELKKPIIVLVVGLIVAAVLAVVSALWIVPAIDRSKASTALKNATVQIQPITVENNQVVSYTTGTKTTNANVTQKALGENNKATTPAGFIFTSGSNDKVVDLYVDLSNQKSRDFLLLNKTSFESLIQYNKVEIIVHSVPTSNAFAMYATEALAESVNVNPKNTWALLMELARQGNGITTTKSSDILKTVATIAQKQGYSGITEKTVGSGHFSDWIVSLSSDAKLKTQYYPPLIYVNGSLVDTSTLNMNDADAVRTRILES